MGILKPFTKKHFLLLLIILVFSAFLFIYFLGSNSIRQNIEAGELDYTCNCGWVDWSHARPEGPSNLINEVVNDTSPGPAAKTMVYSQRMKINLIGRMKLVAEISRRYIFKTNPDRKKREVMAFTIFRETSESFESMQAAFPFNLNLGARRSSFKDGDLTGNAIAFYRALRGYQMEEINKMCKPLSRDSSMLLLEQGKFGKTPGWLPKFWLSTGTFPKELQELRSDDMNASGDLIFLNESRSFYFEP